MTRTRPHYPGDGFGWFVIVAICLALFAFAGVVIDLHQSVHRALVDAHEAALVKECR